MTSLQRYFNWCLNILIFVFAVPAKVIWYKEPEENPA